MLPTESITVVQDIELDVSDNLRVKTVQLDVINAATPSSFVTVTGWTTTTDCP